MSTNCGHCGRFVSYEQADQYTDFGSPVAMEPPDPIWMCPKCSREEEERQVERGYPSVEWRPSQATRRAAERLGYIQQNHGWIKPENNKYPFPR